MKPQSIIFSLVPIKKFDKTATVKSHLASTTQANHHPSPYEIDNNDNKSIVSPSLRPARPDEALRFFGAIEVRS
ncbi:hypothetical protein KY285_028855 [Solanum tuberosum]|nr:hypothetical protein KY289_029036 [Solanum tuberosum]KAH0663932.1 hypothetical protein KY284_028863 [Solanum tuberosum]KAH0667649.1 hypothetical protein KY285_028855 [Solanum tuberosum]